MVSLAAPGTLIICTVVSLLLTLWVLGRPPIMPFIGGSVSISFGALTLITGDPMSVQIKVTLFNALVAVLLWIGLRAEKEFLPCRVSQDIPFYGGRLAQPYPECSVVFPGYRSRERGGAVWVYRRPHHQNRRCRKAFRRATAPCCFWPRTMSRICFMKH
jgi:intracellular septation protein A